jgi:hypothetical protein
VKTSALSKRWVHEWGLRTDLNFDLHTMFDYNTIQDLPNRLPHFQRFYFQSQFATRLDQFMLHYKGPRCIGPRYFCLVRLNKQNNALKTSPEKKQCLKI